MLLLCALIAGSGSVWATDKWVKTDPADLANGDVVVIVDQTSVKAMSNTGSTSSAPSATAVTLNADKSEISSEVVAALQWVVTVDNGSYKFGVSGTTNYLYCTATNNGVRVGTNANNAFTWEEADENSTESFLYNTATKRYIGVYNKSDWRCYTTVNNNIKACVTAFYKKTAGVDPSKDDVTLSFPEASYTADINDGFTAPTASADKTITGIKYSSTNEAVATVNESTGAVTLKKKGVTTIKATFDGDDDYNSAEASYELTVTNRNANDGSQTKPFTVEEAIDFITAKEYGDGNYYVKGIISTVSSSSVISGGYLTYYISDDGTTANQLQVYKGKGKDNAEFTAVDDIETGDEVVVVGPLLYYNDKTPEINTGNYIYSIKSKASAELIVEDDFSMEITTTKSVDDLYATDSDGEVTFSSSDESVAKIEGGLLKALSKGEATITVSVAATDDYKAASESFVVTVTVKPAVAPEGEDVGSGYFLVTDASTLAAGDKVLIVGKKADGSEYYVMTTQESNYRKKENVTVTNNAITTLPTRTQVVTLEGTTDAWYFNVGDDAYLYAPGTGNHLKTNTKETVGDTGKAEIEMDAEGAATVTFQGDVTQNLLRYNSSSPRFSCYSSGQNAVYFYRHKEVNTFDITVGEAGWRTLVSAVNATLPEGLTAYTVTESTIEKATLTKVASVKANEPYLLKGNQGTYTLTVTDTPAEPTGNLLQVSTESTGNGVYVLADKDGVGFYKWTGGSLGAGRVYLPAPAAAAREFLSFDFEETTGINNVESSKLNIEGFYNLAGQRVAQPTKGLYIVNGRKVVIR